MRKLVTALILVPLVVIMVAFAVANREIVTVTFDPFDTVQPAYALRLPLYLLIIVMIALGVVVGGLTTWIKQHKWRTRARRAEADVRALREKLSQQQWSPAGQAALPPAKSSESLVFPPAA
jgi:uncharacterized membrane protein YciS (DUF1049 family)